MVLQYNTFYYHIQMKLLTLDNQRVMRVWGNKKGSPFEPPNNNNEE